MTEQRFTPENTEGYSDAELAELNRRWRIAFDRLDPEHRGDERRRDELAAQILARFDAQRSPQRATPSHYTRHDAPE